jgi:hypothetical protein
MSPFQLPANMFRLNRHAAARELTLFNIFYDRRNIDLTD